MRPLLYLILTSSFAGFVATTCSAAVITAIGENAANAAQWRTQTTKAINPAGNNIYGNDGYVMFTTSNVGAGSGFISGNTSVNPFTYNGTPAISGVTPPVTTLSVMPAYVSAFTPSTSNSAQVFDGVAAGNASFDNPNVPGGQLSSGVGFMGTNDPIFGTTTNAPFFSFTVNEKVPASFTVGLFFTNSGGVVTSAGISGGGVSIGTVTINRPNNVLDALFFSITDAAPGDVYTVYASGGSLADENIDIMGITFDSTPEPTTLAGCAAASLALIWLSRYRPRAEVAAAAEEKGESCRKSRP